MEVGEKERFKMKLVRRILTGHVERMGDEKTGKRTDAQKVKRRRGGPKLRCRIVLRDT